MDKQGSTVATPTGKCKSGFLVSVRAAFSNWWAVLGIVAASVSGFNLARNIIRIELAQVTAEIMRAYQALIHAPILGLSAWLRWPQPPTWAIDAIFLWLLIGGIVLRSAWVLRKEMLGVPPYGRGGIEPLLVHKTALPLFVLAFLFFWPLFLQYLVGEPHVYRIDKSLGTTWPSNGIRMSRVRLPKLDWLYLCDLRIVLAVQASCAVLFIAAWFTLNALLKLYG